MRKPTAKEASVLKGCAQNLLQGDIPALIYKPPSRDVHGTTRVNLTVMLNILKRLEDESDPYQQG